MSVLRLAGHPRDDGVEDLGEIDLHVRRTIFFVGGQMGWGRLRSQSCAL